MHDTSNDLRYCTKCNSTQSMQRVTVASPDNVRSWICKKCNTILDEVRSISERRTKRDAR